MKKLKEYLENRKQELEEQLKVVTQKFYQLEGALLEINQILSGFDKK